MDDSQDVPFVDRLSSKELEILARRALCIIEEQNLVLAAIDRRRWVLKKEGETF